MPTNNDKLRSFKWVDVASGGDKFRLSVTDVQKEVFDKIGTRRPHKINGNLISIFGKAREGKSFLLNCLADSDGLFRISNRPVPCTHGIDIANKWMDLRDFSRVDGGTEAKKKNDGVDLRVGFVDAEGQGDKAMEHDANMCCPVLLLSKCVCFNHKGAIQKDDILSKLGIMARAASSVAKEVSAARDASSTTAEPKNSATTDGDDDKSKQETAASSVVKKVAPDAQDPSSNTERNNAADGDGESHQETAASSVTKEVSDAQDPSSNTAAGGAEEGRPDLAYDESYAYRTGSVKRLAPKQFGHLHIILRDWNSDDFDTAAIYDMLFAVEQSDTNTAAHDGRETRNEIRKEILAAFESVQVWLFPSPNDSGKVLRTEMGKDDMSHEFRDVLREFRAALSAQLAEPKAFAGMPLTGKSIELLMGRIVESLNEGDVVVPSGAYKSMLASELNAALRDMEADLTGQVTALVESIDTTSKEEAFGESYIMTEEAATRQCEELLVSVQKTHDERIRDTICDETSDFGRQLLSGSDYAPLVDGFKKLRRDYFAASYHDILSRWCQRANTEAMGKASERISAMLRQIDVASKTAEDINAEVDLVLESMRDIVGLKRYPENETIRNMDDGFALFITAQREQVLAYNEAKVAAEEKAAAEKKRVAEEKAAADRLEQERAKKEAQQTVGGGGCGVTCCP